MVAVAFGFDFCTLMTFCIAHDTKILICVWFEFDIPSYVDGLGAPKNIALIYCDAGIY